MSSWWIDNRQSWPRRGRRDRIKLRRRSRRVAPERIGPELRRRRYGIGNSLGLIQGNRIASGMPVIEITMPVFNHGTPISGKIRCPEDNPVRNASIKPGMSGISRNDEILYRLGASPVVRLTGNATNGRYPMAGHRAIMERIYSGRERHRTTQSVAVLPQIHALIPERLIERPRSHCAANPWHELAIRKSREREGTFLFYALAERYVLAFRRREQWITRANYPFLKRRLFPVIITGHALRASGRLSACTRKLVLSRLSHLPLLLCEVAVDQSWVPDLSPSGRVALSSLTAEPFFFKRGEGVGDSTL